MNRVAESFALTPIERLYQDHLNALTGSEKIQRALALNRAIVESILSQVEQEYGSLPERDLRYHIARRLYINEPYVLEMIENVYRGT